jgi:hypothetical protein
MKRLEEKNLILQILTRKCFNLPRLLEIINGLCMFVVITIITIN